MNFFNNEILWSMIPKDILFCIGQKMNIQQLWNCRRVCKNWNKNILSFDTDLIMPKLTGIEKCYGLDYVQTKNTILMNPKYHIMTNISSEMISKEEFLLRCDNQKIFMLKEFYNDCEIGFVQEEEGTLKLLFLKIQLENGLDRVHRNRDIPLKIKEKIFRDRQHNSKIQTWNDCGNYIISFQRLESGKYSVCRITRSENNLPNTNSVYPIVFDKDFALNCTFNYNKNEFYIYDISENLFHILDENIKVKSKTIQAVDKMDKYSTIKVFPTLKTCLIAIIKYKTIFFVNPIDEFKFGFFEFPTPFITNSPPISYTQNVLSVFINGKSFYMDRYLMKHKKSFQIEDKYTDYKTRIGFCDYGLLMRFGMGFQICKFDWKKYQETINHQKTINNK